MYQNKKKHKKLYILYINNLCFCGPKQKKYTKFHISNDI